MTYHKIEDFIADWQDECNNTLKIFTQVTEETKPVKVHENIRTLERLAWHITQSITEMGKRAGLLEEDTLEHLAVPALFQEIVTAYQRYNMLLAKAVRNKWDDASLEDEVDMYGENWKKGKVLAVLIAHEAHHRSQMTVIMRLVGLPVPGIYGPSKEEWALMGMAPME